MSGDDHNQGEASGAPVCAGCGGRVELIDVSTGPFSSMGTFWAHVDMTRNYSHSAAPIRAEVSS